MVNHFVFSAFVVFIVTLLAGIYFTAKPKNSVEKSFGLFWLSVSFWTFFVGTQLELLKWLSGFKWGWFLHVGCILVPIFFLHFALRLTGTFERFSFWLKLAGFIGTLFVLLNTFTNRFTAETIYRDFYAYPKPAVLYPLYILFFQLIGIATLILLLGWSKKLPGNLKGTFYLFLVVHILAYIGSMDNYLIMYDVKIFPLYPYGLYLVLPYVIFGSSAVRKLQVSAQS